MPLSPKAWKILSYEFKDKAVRHDNDPLTNIYWKILNDIGQALQRFLAHGLPSWAVRSEVHKILESEVWARAWEKAENCNYKPSISNIKTYAFGIAIKVLNEWRRENYGGPPPGTVANNAKSSLDTTMQNELLQDLNDCLQDLARKNINWYTAVSLTMLLKYIDKEAAEVMDCVKSTVCDRRKNGLRFLKRCLRKKSWDEKKIWEVLAK